MESLTDLEAAALAAVHQEGACTAYALRRGFRASPSARFSDSAGSVYPMVRRLARRGLLRRQRVRQGKRPASVYACTDAGLAALRAWIAVPEDAAQLVTWDPLRTRCLALGALTPRERVRWVDSAQRALDAHEAAIRSARKATEDPWMLLAHRNALLQVSARRKWLREVRAALADA